MRVVEIVTPPASSYAGTSSPSLAEWRVGAILQATAIRDAATRQLWLQIGDTRHPARIASGDERGPAHGEQLQLRVLRNSPVLALETLARSHAMSQDTAISEALRRHLPRQASPALLLANLAWIAQGKSGTDALPRAVTQAAMNLWQVFATPHSLRQPDGLQEAMMRSGAFLEANLAASQSGNGAALARTDLKALMLMLSRLLREHGARPAAARADAEVHAPVPTAPGPLTTLLNSPATFALADTPMQQLHELARQTEGALARLTTLQIANSTQEGGTQTLLLEVPFRDEDRASMLRLRVQRDASGHHADAADSAWSIEAALDLGTAGPLHARITLRGQRVGVQLRAASATFVDTLAAHTTQLEAMLREAGLEIDRVVCLHGMPAAEQGARHARLLDIRA